MVSLLLGFGATVGAGYWLYLLTKDMPKPTAHKLIAIGVLLFVGGVLTG